MRTLRIYKILIPGLLVLVLVVLAQQLKPVGGAHSQPAGPDGLQIGSSAEGVTAVDMDGANRNMEISAGKIERDESGRLDLEQIHELKLFREDMLPLVIEAFRGTIDGQKGARTMTFTEGVSLDDSERGLKLSIPGLVIDEATQEARAEGGVELEGGGVSGTATRLVYRIDGRPAELEGLAFDDGTGAKLVAARAVLHDGLDDVELEGEVLAERGPEFLGAARLRVKRHPDSDRIASLSAQGQVHAAFLLDTGQLVAVSGEAIEAAFEEDGSTREIGLDGGARLARGSESISSESLSARRAGGAGRDWNVIAQGDVVLDANFGAGPALLRAARVDALLGAGGLLEGTASGRVSLDGPDTRAEAEQVAFTGGDPGTIRLSGTARRKARLARFGTRVVAEEITTDPRAEHLRAERGVEATLLPAADGPAVPAGPFVVGEAVHFVSQTLDGEHAGGLLVFEGQVRGWQGERNLSAGRVTISSASRTLIAEGDVTTRIPRKEAEGAKEADYIQISAGRLDYADATRIGVFSEDVRVQLLEGWMEAQSVEFEKSADGSGLREIRAQGAVRLEFREPEPAGAPKVLTGTADRLVYDPTAQTIWLIGEASPATVRRIGEERGTTTGRVLRYRLDLGTLEVESGRIQTGR